MPRDYENRELDFNSDDGFGRYVTDDHGSFIGFDSSDEEVE